MKPEIKEALSQSEIITFNSRRLAIQVLRDALGAQRAAAEIINTLAETEEQKANGRDLRYFLRNVEVVLEEAEAIYG